MLRIPVGFQHLRRIPKRIPDSFFVAGFHGIAHDAEIVKKRIRDSDLETLKICLVCNLCLGKFCMLLCITVRLDVYFLEV